MPGFTGGVRGIRGPGLMKYLDLSSDVDTEGSKPGLTSCLDFKRLTAIPAGQGLRDAWTSTSTDLAKRSNNKFREDESLAYLSFS